MENALLCYDKGWHGGTKTTWPKQRNSWWYHMVMIRNGNDFCCFLFLQLFFDVRVHWPPSLLGFLGSLLSTERVVCHSWLFCGNLFCGKLWRYEAPSHFPFQHSISTQGVWMRGVDKPDILPFARGVDPAPLPAPLATHFSCSKRLITPHSPLNFNLAILISAPGASKFTSLW